MIIKPNKRSYIFSLILADSIAILFFGFIIWSLSSLSLFLIVIFISFIYILYSAIISYSGEKYELKENSIEIHYKSLFSENNFAINYNEIKEISYQTSLRQKILFGTGNIVIKRNELSNPIKLSNINYSQKIIQNILKLSPRLNFSHPNDILLEAKLETSGLDKDLFIKITGSILFLIIYGLFASNLVSLGTQGGFLILIGTFITLFFISYLYYSHKDLKDRKYIIFKNGIYFVEGSLIKKHFLAPIRGKIEINYKKEFIEKLFGEGCKLNNKTVFFKTLFSGEDLLENIKSLYSIKQVETNNIQKTYFYPSKTKTILNIICWSVIGIIATIMTPNDSFYLEFILLILIILKIFINFIKGIGYYFVFDKKFFRVKHSFLSFLNSELETDKITSVIFSENLFDKLLGTYSITFWSLEKEKPIQFSNIKKSLILKEYITKLLKIKKEETKYNIITNFKVINYIKSRIYIILMNIFAIIIISFFSILLNSDNTLLTIIILNISVYLLIILYKYYHSKTTITHFKPSYIYHKSGIIKQEEFFIDYRNVNDIHSTQYIGSHNGKLSFDLSGEYVFNTPYGQIRVPNKLRLNFIEDVFKARNALENLIRENEVGIIENSYYTRSEVKNEILKYTLLSLPIITIPFILPFAIYDILHTGVKSYYIKGDKIIEKTGVINQKEVSILISKIKDVRIKKTFTGKIFDNANIEVMTIGAGIVDFELKYIKNYKDFYNKINEILIPEAKEEFKHKIQEKTEEEKVKEVKKENEE